MPFMTLEKREKFAIWGLLVFLFALASILPSVLTTTYASPDETATAIVAQNIAARGQAFLIEPLAQVFPWLHPRSWVSAGEHIVPVGFLGWPWLMSFFSGVNHGAWLSWIAALIIVSSAWPFYHLLRRYYGMVPAWWGTLVAFTLPPFILYADRSLFSNAAVIAIGLWSAWMISVIARSESASDAAISDHAERLLRRMTPRNDGIFLLGFLSALTAAIRPIELLWIIPWWLWAARGWRPSKQDWQMIGLGASIVFIPMMVLAYQTYGTALGFGYLMRDNISTLSQLQPTTYNPQPTLQLPFGFDVHHILKNIMAYFIRLLWPWMLIVVVALYVAWKDRRSLQVFKSTPFVLVAWTMFVMLIIYGSGWYADHIGFWAPTIGNSFLRYTLPLALFIGWAAAYLWKYFGDANTPAIRRTGIWRNEKRSGAPSQKMVAMIIIGIFLVGFGIYRAVFADDESLRFTRVELQRYGAIRASAHVWFEPGDVIASETSDKIFFPDFRAVSPLPPKTELARLARLSGQRVGFFGRPLSQEQKDAWLAVGLEAQELASFSRERLYLLTLRTP